MKANLVLLFCRSYCLKCVWGWFWISTISSQTSFHWDLFFHSHCSAIAKWSSPWLFCHKARPEFGEKCLDLKSTTYFTERLPWNAVMQTLIMWFKQSSTIHIPSFLKQTGSAGFMQEMSKLITNAPMLRRFLIWAADVECRLLLCR